MPTYILLSNLTDEGAKSLKTNPKRVQEVNKEIEKYGAKVTARREADALPDIFRELQLRKERHPVRPLFEGKWA